MDVFQTAQKAIRDIEESINPTIKETVDGNELTLINYQTQEQLFKGKDSKGSVIRPGYTPFTIRLKKAKGQPTDRVTWRDTGKLYQSVRIESGTNDFKVVVNVSYANDLIEKYGQDAIGIQREFLREFVLNFIVPNITRKTNDKLTRS